MIKKIFGFLRFYRLPLYIITNPVDGFYAMKYEKQGTIKVALLNLVLLGIAYAINTQYTSIIVSQRHPNMMNTWFDFQILIIMLILFSVSNWSVTCLTNGEGRFKDIVMAICYAMTPLILTIIPATIISNFLSEQETGFYNMILAVGVGYFVFLVFLGLLTVHNYTVVQALLMVFFTFIALLVIVFLIALLFTLWTQLMSFVFSVHREIVFRN